MEKKVRDTQSFNLSQMPAGSITKVVAVRGGGRIAQRLMEMGVVPGVSVKVIKMNILAKTGLSSFVQTTSNPACSNPMSMNPPPVNMEMIGIRVDAPVRGTAR